MRQSLTRHTQTRPTKETHTKNLHNRPTDLQKRPNERDPMKEIQCKRAQTWMRQSLIRHTQTRPTKETHTKNPHHRPTDLQKRTNERDQVTIQTWRGRGREWGRTSQDIHKQYLRKKPTKETYWPTKQQQKKSPTDYSDVNRARTWMRQSLTRAAPSCIALHSQVISTPKPPSPPPAKLCEWGCRGS